MCPSNRSRGIALFVAVVFPGLVAWQVPPHEVGIACADSPQCGDEASVCRCDEAGRLVFRETDRSDDLGTLIEQEFWSYDEDGSCADYIQSFSSDWRHSGPFTPQVGCRTYEQVYFDGLEPVAWEVYTLDEAGRWLRWERHRGGESAPWQRTVRTYDEAGNLTVEEQDGVDPAPCDGTVDIRTTRTWNAAGHETSVQQDFGADGVIEVSTVRTFDEAGNLVSERRDADGDGAWDFVGSFEYDDQGRITAAVMDGWAVPTVRWHYELDPATNRLVRILDAYDVRANGELERCVYDPPCDSPIQYCMGTCSPVAEPPELPPSP